MTNIKIQGISKMQKSKFFIKDISNTGFIIEKFKNDSS